MCKRLLVMEDHAPTRKLVRLAVAPLALEVSEASDVDEALRCVELARPDIAIVDVMVPGARNGYDLSAILKDRYGDDVKIIILTARTDAADRAMARAARADHYLTKPFNYPELVYIVASEIAKAARPQPRAAL